MHPTWVLQFFHCTQVLGSEITTSLQMGTSVGAILECPKEEKEETVTRNNRALVLSFENSWPGPWLPMLAFSTFSLQVSTLSLILLLGIQTVCPSSVKNTNKTWAPHLCSSFFPFIFYVIFPPDRLVRERVWLHKHGWLWNAGKSLKIKTKALWFKHFSMQNCEW